MNIQKLIRPNIKLLKPYSSARDEFQQALGVKIFLDANESPFESRVNRYPDPRQTKLKKLLSEKNNIPTQNILLGNGSDEVLDLIFRVFCEPNEDNVIILPPTYGMYKVLANINAIEVLSIPLSSNFQPQIDQILKTANSNSKLLFLCSPNNPTANCFNIEKMESLIRKFRGLVVIDEAYIDFALNESWLKRLHEFPNLIVTQTFSKAYGMAGIRLGVCYASSTIIDFLNKIKPPYNVNSLTQTYAIEQLLNSTNTQKKIDEIIFEKNKLIDNLKAIEFIKKVYHSDANFILIEVDDANKRYDQLIKMGIVVRNRSQQPLCANCLRLTVGTANENLTLLETLLKLK